MNRDRQADGTPTDQPHGDGGRDAPPGPHADGNSDDELVEKWREILRRRREAEDELRRRRQRDAGSPPTRISPDTPEPDTGDKATDPETSQRDEGADSASIVSERVIDLRDASPDTRSGSPAKDALSTKAFSPMQSPPRPREADAGTAPAPPAATVAPAKPDEEPANAEADRPPRGHAFDARPTQIDRRDVEVDLRDTEERLHPAHAVAAAREEKKQKKRKRLTWVIVVVVLALALLIADLVYVGLGMYDSLQSAKTNLQRGRVALEAGRYDDAEGLFSKARGDSQSAVDLRGHPVFWIAEHTGWTKSDSRALAALADAAVLTSTAGTRAVQAMDSVGETSQGFAEALYNDGEIRLSAAEEAAPAINEVNILLSDALELLETAPDARTNAVSDALETARVDVSEASRLVNRASTVVDALPSLFGADSPRRYLLVFQALSEIRGSGGVAEYYGVLEASDGQLTLGSVRPADELLDVTIPADRMPGWFADRYGRFDALTNWQRATFSPTFPVTAKTLMTMYEEATGKSVDGVLAMDPILLGLMTDATGAIAEKGLNEVITRDNAPRVLMYEIYKHFEGRPEARDSYVIGVIERTWAIVTQGVKDVTKLIAALSEAQTTQHIKVFSEIEEDQSALRELGLAADPTSVAGNLQMVFHNNLAGNRIDYFFRRAVETSIELDVSGSASVTSTAILENRFHTSEDKTSFLAGTATDRAAWNQMNLSWILPEGAQVGRVDAGRLGRNFREGWLEAELPVVAGNLDIPPGGTTRVTVEYEIPRAVDFTSGRGEFRFTLFPQTAPYADNFTLLITPPDGYQIEEQVGEGVTTDDGYGVTGTLDRPVTVQLGLVAE